MSVHIYTSITSNYLPKARVLARSVKQAMPDACFHLVLCDDPPANIDWEAEPFDNLIQIQDLPIDAGWIFGHAVVELCTAVKGFAMQALFRDHGADKVFYFDPDMVVFGRLHELAAHLDNASILLTPHQTVPETSIDAIMDNEMASLKYGVFNLGFVGVRADDNGLAFADWWAGRLRHFCHDDRASGLFTDQKWVNLAPCFFDGIEILRSPAFNVATWNITNRAVSGSLAEGFCVNGEALGFYHFSGFDSGDQALMLGKYGSDNAALAELRRWYIDECERQGQSVLGTMPCVFSGYASGAVITAPERRLYRQRDDLKRAFPDPFASEPQGGYEAWYRVNVRAAAEHGDREERPPAEVLEEFCTWLSGRAALAPGRVRAFMLRSLSALLRWSAQRFARS